VSVSVFGLCVSYGARAVLRDVCFSARDGALTAVLGANGAGKTTLFRCALGLIRWYEGEIRVDDLDARALSPREMACRLAYIPQAHAQAFGYSALDMVLMGAARGISPVSAPGRREREAAMEALNRLGICGLSGACFSRLSGGEQQLVLIARALAQRARTLIMDEPTSSLDYGNQARVLGAVRALADEGYAVILSTHNPQHALWYADEALALCGGTVAACGAPGEVVSAALVERLYGVRVRLVETEGGPLLSPEGAGRRAPESIN
jgi:ABC-type cobalamin/Fe3+-siderophores transport system ATPase subunit